MALVWKLIDGQMVLEEEAGAVPTGDNDLVVAAVNGDDSTGTKGVFSLPFKTIPAANAAAVPGDRILGFGDFDVRDFIIDGVDYEIFGNVIYTGTDIGGLIDDTLATGQNGKIVSNIIIHGKLVNSKTTAGLTRILNLDNAASRITITCREATMTNASNEYGSDIDGGAEVVFNGEMTSPVFPFGGGKMTINGNLLSGVSTNFSGASNPNSELIINGNVISTSNSPGIICNTDASLFVSGDIICSATDFEALDVGNATVRVLGQIISTGSNAAQGVECNAVASPNKVELLGGVSCVGGFGVLLRSAAKNVFLEGRIESKLDTVDGHGIEFDVGTNVVILNSCTIICANDGAKSINTSGMASSTINNGACVATNAVHEDVVQKVSNILISKQAK